jgi:hypothetical protein
LPARGKDEAGMRIVWGKYAKAKAFADLVEDLALELIARLTPVNFSITTAD